MNKLGVAVIGTGYWGQHHVRIYSELENTNLVAVCDTNGELVASVAKEYKKYNVKTYTNSVDMLKNSEIEAVSVCTPATSLSEEALKCLNSDKHVLVEKPMATDTKQAKTLIDIAEANGLCLAIGFLTRFFPGVQQIKRAIAMKEIGEIVTATAKRVSQRPERISNIGVVKDTAIHDIDIMRFILGEEPISVRANMGNKQNQIFEDNAEITLTYENGKTALINADWLTTSKTRSLDVIGSDADMQLNYMSQELRIKKDGENVQLKTTVDNNPLKTELEHFIKCIVEKKKPVITGEDGYNALKIVEAAMESAIKNTVIKLSK
ncbi:MAG: Gfo/Idh/MocA family oxidoreductase [Nitrososphaerota archaeon]|nr:Gfo/Idh/MocA family oxidoreductase [Nitrososphaerota archaeon]